MNCRYVSKNGQFNNQWRKWCNQCSQCCSRWRHGGGQEDALGDQFNLRYYFRYCWNHREHPFYPDMEPEVDEDIHRGLFDCTGAVRHGAPGLLLHHGLSDDASALCQDQLRVRCVFLVHRLPHLLLVCGLQYLDDCWGHCRSLHTSVLVHKSKGTQPTYLLLKYMYTCVLVTFCGQLLNYSISYRFLKACTECIRITCG